LLIKCNEKEKFAEENRNELGRKIRTSMYAGLIGCYKRQRERERGGEIIA
jgi:hypothetical protein